MRSRACQPSISTIVTGERVQKYWLILGILNPFSRNSVPASEDQWSELGRRSDVIHWLVFESVPHLAQCSVYTTRVWMDVLHLVRVWLHLAMLSISFLAKCNAVSHRPFHSPRWKRLTLDTICLTLSRRLHDISSVGRNWATTSRMCTAKESRGYLSARSKTRCILEANCSIFSPLGITLAMRKIMRRTVRRWICSERRETVNVSLRSRKGFQF